MDPGQEAFRQALHNLAKHDHLCLIYETRAEQFAAAVPFMRFGLERGERCIYIADDNTVRAVLGAMKVGGINTDAALASGALTIATKQDTYLKRGCFDPDWMIEFLAQATAEARAAGYSALRITGEMTWMLGGDPGVERLIEYEAKLNFFFPEHDALAICQYNRRRFSPALILDVIRTHPLVIYGGWVCRNPYYTPPDEMLSGKEDYRAVERMLTSLREREREQAALQESEERYRILAETAQDAICVLDREDRLRYINPYAAALFGKPPTDLVGQSLAQLFPPEVVEAQHANIERVFKSGQSVNYEAERYLPTGRRWLNIQLAPLKKADDEVDTVLCIARDITEQVWAREALQQALKQAEHVRDLLFSLGQAAQAVQCARVPEEVYKTIGEQAGHLGYKTMIFEFDTAKQELHLAYTSYDTSLVHQAEKITGLSQHTYCFQPQPDSVYGRVLAQGETIYVADPTQVITDALPQLLSALARPLSELFQRTPATLAPMKAGDKTFGILYLSGADLTEADIPAVAAFASQATIALENARLYAQAQHEIAERKRTEEALRKSKELFEKTFTSQRAAIFILDAQIPPVILDCNPAATETFGYARHEMIGRTIAFLHASEETLREFQRRLYPAIEEQGFLQLPEFTMRRKDGATFPSEHSVVPLKDEEGRRIGWISVVQDITERVQARTRLELQNQRLQTLRQIDTAILAADSVENIINAALGRLCKLIECQCACVVLMDQGAHTAQVFSLNLKDESPRLTRMSVADVMASSLIRILSNDQPSLINEPDTLSELSSVLPTLVEEGLHSLCLLPLRVHGDLVGMFGMASSVPSFFDEDKVAIGREVTNQIAIAIAQNNLLTTLRALNAELEARVAERTAQLEAINKELEAFSYSVSHDLRAPLRIVDGFSKALVNRYWDALDDEGRSYLTRIRENTRRMGQLIDDLLALSRITRQEMKWEHVDLSHMVRAIAEELRAQAPERCIDFEIEDQLEAWGDTGLLRILFYNLLDNACKFTSKCTQAVICFGKVRDESQATFFVRDNGVGFDMAYADKLFGAFQRLHSANEFPGSGIGLATVQRIIYRHGGRIWAEAEVNKGATFYFTLGNHP